jgi:hypothetical protein
MDTKWLMAALQAIVAAVLGWVGLTTASLNREVGELKVQVGALQSQVTRIESKEDGVSRRDYRGIGERR